MLTHWGRPFHAAFWTLHPPKPQSLCDQLLLSVEPTLDGVDIPSGALELDTP